jgi:hypothetical protein
LTPRTIATIISAEAPFEVEKQNQNQNIKNLKTFKRANQGELQQLHSCGSFIGVGVEQAVHLPAKVENLHLHFIQLEEDFLVGFFPLYLRTFSII